MVCGPSGCGKSTTLAALVNLLNETRQHHVITLEEPVEFIHPFKNCLINQREIGSDSRSYARALRAALRENPDVIVIGDLRDTETVSLALTAAETGHLVLATMSSTTAPKAINRIISSFAADEQPQVRAGLAESLKYVIAQRLLALDGTRKRVACFEVLVGTVSVAHMITEEKTHQLPSAMQIGKAQGMQTFDDSLRELLRLGRISAESAYLHATNREDFEALVSPEFLESRILPMTEVGYRIDRFLRLMNDRGASDLHLAVGRPPMLRVSGAMEQIRYRIVRRGGLPAHAPADLRRPKRWAGVRGHRRHRLRLRGAEPRPFPGQPVPPPARVRGGVSGHSERDHDRRPARAAAPDPAPGRHLLRPGPGHRAHRLGQVHHPGRASSI